MSNIMNYSYLIQNMFGVKNSTWRTGSVLPGTFQFSQLNSGVVQSQLKAAGINTGSRQYKAVIQKMTESGCTGGMFTNVQAIKNLMKQYNSDGDYVGADGSVVPGMLVSGNADSSSLHKMIDISEEYRQKIFDMVKEEFIRENGVANGDTTNRSSVYRAYQLSIDKSERLKGTWSLQQYESKYSKAFYDAVKTADTDWQAGQSFDAGILDSVTRDSVESNLKISGNTLKFIDVKI